MKYAFLFVCLLFLPIPSYGMEASSHGDGAVDLRALEEGDGGMEGLIRKLNFSETQRAEFFEHVSRWRDGLADIVNRPAGEEPYGLLLLLRAAARKSMELKATCEVQAEELKRLRKPNVYGLVCTSLCVLSTPIYLMYLLGPCGWGLTSWP